MTQWWKGLEPVQKTVRAAIGLVLLGMTAGAVLLRGDVVGNTAAIELNTVGIRANTATVGTLQIQVVGQGEKLDRIICYQEEQTKTEPNYARCTR